MGSYLAPNKILFYMLKLGPPSKESASFLQQVGLLVGRRDHDLYLQVATDRICPVSGVAPRLLPGQGSTTE